MTNEKSMWLFAFLITFFKGNYFLNSTLMKVPETSQNIILLQNQSLLPGGSNSESNGSSTEITFRFPQQTTMPNNSNITGIDSTNVKQSDELMEIFNGVSENASDTDGITLNGTLIKDCVNVSFANVTCVEPARIDAAKANYTTTAEAAEALNSEVSNFRLEKSAAIAAGIFLVSAVIGYFSCVGYRRFLQRKYGNTQVLIGDEVYDTTDLRYFEI